VETGIPECFQMAVLLYPTHFSINVVGIHFIGLETISKKAFS
jgi:hypothetical protein